MTSVLIEVLGNEPITLDEAKGNLRFSRDFVYEDERITGLIKAAREYAEEYTGRAIVLQKRRATLDRFQAGTVLLPYPPLVSITADETYTDLGVAYVDSAGDSQTLVIGTDIWVDADSEPARIAPVDAWPVADVRLGAVTLTYLAGYADTALVPQRVKRAMHLLIKDWFEDGEGRISDTVQKRADTLLRSAWSGSLAGTFG